MNHVESVATWLQATGPYGIVVILGWAFWRIHERKDQALRELYQRVTEMSAAQIRAITKMESALIALKDVIDQLHDRAP